MQVMQEMQVMKIMKIMKVMQLQVMQVIRSMQSTLPLPKATLALYPLMLVKLKIKGTSRKRE